jgi:hypothetical protein
MARTRTNSECADRMRTSKHMNTDLFPYIRVYARICIQNVPIGKVNILGGHSIGHCKQKSVYAHVS